MISDFSTPTTITPASPTERATILSLQVSLGNYQEFQDALINAAHRGESRTACFANVHMAVEAHRDPEFAKVVNSADWVCTDGLPLTWAMRLLHRQHQDRVTGPDTLNNMVKRAAKEQLPIFFYGSTNDVLAKAVAVCRERYPAIQIAGTLSPPFRSLTIEEEEEIIDQINKSGARLVFVALGCPKQERWMARMRGKVQAVMLGIGGGLPILAGVQSRPPQWIQRIGMEWFYRLALEPRRLFKRYAVTNSLYGWYLGKQWLFQR
jgi:N-acetylglucosaminyldiphosphoundecaprenol N-acetyl-beta-D-mannosaminyltransferase